MVFKSLAFPAIINCSAQEYDTPSTTNDEGHHCKKWDGGCQNNTTLFVEYSREGSNDDGANPSETVLGIWACNFPVREHQSSAVRACNVPVRENQALGSRCESGPRFLAPCPRPSFAKNRQKLLLTAPEGAGGSKLLLLDERYDTSVD